MAQSLNDFLPDSSAPIIENGYGLVTKSTIKALLRPRKPFSHKGTYGHALIVAGAAETMGAALLAAKGCLYGGAGLTTACIPQSGLTALNTSLPEVMYAGSSAVLHDEHSLKKYNAVGIGPGLNLVIEDSFASQQILEQVIHAQLPFVADATALSLLSDPEMPDLLLAQAILTPHMKEFDQLFGSHTTWWERLVKASKIAKEKRIVIVLKNQYTFIIDQEGLLYINTTGNPAMAQGGMGDVLTGIITAYLAQGYTLKEAALLGCFVHGMTGDELAADHTNITASQLAAQIPKTVKRLLG